MLTLAEIQALPAALRATQDTQAIANALSVGRVKVVPREIGKGRVLSALGLENGNGLLDLLDSTELFRHVKQLAANGWLDVGDPLTRAMIDQTCTFEDAATLKALAEVPDPVSEFEVRCLCWADNGDWIV